jgi:hypothetical protein
MFNLRALSSRSREKGPVALIIGALVAVLWGLHAAGPSIPPGRGYVRFGCLFGVAFVCMVWRRSLSRIQVRHATKNGVVVGLSVWLFGATLSAILNWQTDQVLFTYFVVFFCGALIYGALSGVALTRTDLDLAMIGLVVGSLFPLLTGLQAFGTEFGTPDASTFVAAYTNRLRMASYEMATFGNRGNTAAFLLILAPILLTIGLDKKKNWAFRGACGLAMVPVLLNFMIIQVRAGFLTLLVSLMVIWWFKRGARSVPLLAGALVFGWLALVTIEPDAVWAMRERIVAAVTVDKEGDNSVGERVEAMNEGLQIAKRNWLLGIGPGAGPTVHSHDSAHQLQINQAMETGIFGFLGSAIFAAGILICLGRTLARGANDELNEMRFLLLIGPASYVTYAVAVNAALTNSSVNTWAVLVTSMVALMPPFDPRGVRKVLP